MKIVRFVFVIVCNLVVNKRVLCEYGVYITSRIPLYTQFLGENDDTGTKSKRIL